MQTHLNEWRALRDAYALRAAAALARHNPAMTNTSWHRYCDAVKTCPVATVDGVMFLAERIGDYTDFAAITRFAWLCDQVWSLESEAMDDVTYPQWRYGKTSLVA